MNSPRKGKSRKNESSRPAPKKKLPTTENAEKPRRSKAKNYNSYAIYILRLKKSVAPDMSLSKKSMQVLESFVSDILERIATEAVRLADYGKSSHKHRNGTISAHCARTAVKLMLTGELEKCAISEGDRACLSFMKEFKGNKDAKVQREGN